jgi:thiol:disulfide interchange protein DsbC
MKKVVEERKDIVFLLKMFPLPMHKGAYEKAKSIVCEKSLQLLEENFEKKPVPAPDCDTHVVDDNIRLAKELDITGTPTLVMPDGFVLLGGKDAEALIKLVLEHTGKGKSATNGVSK